MIEQAKDKIFKFIGSHVSPHRLNDDDDIFQLALVNSLFAMQLVGFVEKEFAIKVENEELKIDNFKSVTNLTKYVECKLVNK